MVAVVCGWLSPDVVDAVQRFRGAIYEADGAVKLTEGRHVEAADEDSYHLILLGKTGIEGCLRYHRTFVRCRRMARIGGWALAESVRNTGAAIRLPIAAVRLAKKLGDDYGVATATTRHNSAGILQRLGGRLVATYWDSSYGCEMQRIEFYMADMGRLVTHRRAA